VQNIALNPTRTSWTRQSITCYSIHNPEYKFVSFWQNR